MADQLPSLSGILSDLSKDAMFSGDGGLGFGDMGNQSRRRGGMSVAENREPHFNRESGRFHDPTTGEFEPGGAPPDLDRSVNRFRAEDGQFKQSSSDLFDEPMEVRRDSLEPRG